MIYFLKGKVFETQISTLLIEHYGVCYELLVSHSSLYQKGEEILIYTYEVFTEDSHYLVGLYSLEEKEIFLSLIKVQGIGPKTAINILANTTPHDIKNAIASNNVAYLKRLPGIGIKAANQIILDLKDKITDGTKGNPEVYEEAFSALKTLGFKATTIDRVLSTINVPNITSEELVKFALERMQK